MLAELFGGLSERYAALHEAGHAVCCVHYGAEVTHISLRVVSHLGGGMPFERMVIAYGGGAATAHGVGTTIGAEDDYANVDPGEFGLTHDDAHQLATGIVKANWDLVLFIAEVLEEQETITPAELDLLLWSFDKASEERRVAGQ